MYIFLANLSSYFFSKTVYSIYCSSFPCCCYCCVCVCVCERERGREREREGHLDTYSPCYPLPLLSGLCWGFQQLGQPSSWATNISVYPTRTNDHLGICMLCSPYLNSPFLYIYLSFWHFCAQLRNIWFRNLWVSLGYEEVYEVTLRLMSLETTPFPAVLPRCQMWDGSGVF